MNSRERGMLALAINHFNFHDGSQYEDGIRILQLLRQGKTDGTNKAELSACHTLCSEYQRVCVERDAATSALRNLMESSELKTERVKP